MDTALPEGARPAARRGQPEGLRRPHGRRRRPQKAILAWRRAPYGTSSTYDALVAARRMHLDDATIGQIECPTLLTDPDHEQFWPGQSQRLYDALTCPKQLLRFTEEEGADWHCEPAAQALRDERVFDWLEETLGLGG